MSVRSSYIQASKRCLDVAVGIGEPRTKQRCQAAPQDTVSPAYEPHVCPPASRTRLLIIKEEGGDCDSSATSWKNQQSRRGRRLNFFFLMIRRPPRSTLFPYTTRTSP